MGPKLVLALSIVALIGSLCLVAAERAILLLGQSHVRALTAIVGLAAAAALAIVLYRTVKLPPPAGFVARQYGIYLAALGCLTTVITCSQQLLRPN